MIRGSRFHYPFVDGQQTMPRSEEIRFEVIYASSSAGSKFAEEVTQDLEDKIGWDSKKRCSYPQQMIVQLETITNVVKIQILCHKTHIPKKIDFSIGEVDQTLVTRDARDLEYERIGFTEFVSSETRGDASERRNVYVDGTGNLLRLKIHKNIRSSDNRYDQVGLKSIRIIGYPQEKPSRVKGQPPPQSQPMNQAAAAAGAGCPHCPVHKQQPPTRPNCPVHGVDIAKMSLSSSKDPIIEIRAVATAINSKKQDAILWNRTYDQKMYTTALECLQKAEEDIQEVNQERRTAVQNGDKTTADACEIRAAQIRDNCLRAIKVDQLLDPLEVAAVRNAGNPSVPPSCLCHEAPPPDPPLRAPAAPPPHSCTYCAQDTPASWRPSDRSPSPVFKSGRVASARNFGRRRSRRRKSRSLSEERVHSESPRNRRRRKSGSSDSPSRSRSPARKKGSSSRRRSSEADRRKSSRRNRSADSASPDRRRRRSSGADARKKTRSRRKTKTETAAQTEKSPRKRSK